MPKDVTDEMEEFSDEMDLDESGDPTMDGGEGPEGEGRRSRWRRLTKRLMDRRELSNDTKVLLSTVLETSDKAKTEAVKMMAREVRSYLEALELKEAVQEVMTSYSLEISVSLKPLAEHLDGDEADPFPLEQAAQMTPDEPGTDSASEVLPEPVE